jgi:ferredoxin-thioredoxin reductase catalytic subunit
VKKEKLIKIWKDFTEKNDFILNPDEKMTNAVADGVLANEKESGLKLCPCRLSTPENELELICPCNFKAQQVWTEKGRCWCGLFLKKTQHL